MLKIKTDLFEQFVAAEDYLRNIYFALVRADAKGDKSAQKEFESYDKGLVQRLEDACVAGYSENLKTVGNYKEEYFRDIKEAAHLDNLYWLDILIQVPTVLPLLDPSIDVFILDYLVVYFGKFNDEIKSNYAKYLFEQVLDTADSGLEEYIGIIDRLFSLNKEPNWYNNFYDQITKLIYLAPVQEETLIAVKKGLTGTSEHIKSIIEEYIENKFG